MTARGRLLALFDDLGPDEQALLVLIAERLSLGRDVYGPLDVTGDRRDWVHEGLEELADGLVYMACAVIRDRRQSRESARETLARVARERLSRYSAEEETEDAE